MGRGHKYTLVTTEGIDGPRTRLESGLADEECRETQMSVEDTATPKQMIITHAPKGTVRQLCPCAES